MYLRDRGQGASHQLTRHMRLKMSVILAHDSRKATSRWTIGVIVTSFVKWTDGGEGYFSESLEKMSARCSHTCILFQSAHGQGIIFLGHSARSRSGRKTVVITSRAVKGDISPQWEGDVWSNRMAGLALPPRTFRGPYIHVDIPSTYRHY